MKPAAVIKFLVALALSFSPALFAYRFTDPNNLLSWYAKLNKPFFTPPSWLFGPVWFVLYLLMAVAAFLISQKGLKNTRVKIALLAFLVQLLLNALWTPFFFGLKNPLLALTDILLLLLAIIITIITFAKLSRRAALLLVPYLLWTSFAAALNISICLMNR